MTDITTDPNWADRGACVGMDPDEFYPQRHDTAAINAAKRVCRACEVREVCLEYAIANNERAGIWGGLGDRARKRIRIDRNAAAKANT